MKCFKVMVAVAVVEIVKFLHEMRSSGLVDDVHYDRLITPLIGFLTMTGYGYLGEGGPKF